MYKHLQSIATFIAVAEAGAFNKAADALGVQASVVSHHVSKLEEHLGTTLIYRTTRKVSLSEHGRILFDASKKWLDGTAQAVDQIMDAQDEAIGALNVSLPAFVPEPEVENAILNFIELHPHVSITLNYSDTLVDLVEDNFDLCIRLGNPPDSSFIARKLAQTQHILVASPNFISRHGMPQEPVQLAKLPYVSMDGLGDTLTLTRGKQKVEVHNTICQINTNNIYGAKAAAENGLGIGNLPIALCEQSVTEGKLVHILPNWKLSSFPLIAIWPDASRRHTLTKRLVNHIISAL
ncbi:LysR family transcriptional regulator [Shewanella nanhaiensis]|uniref:LysR family transcriptional regulator n=1 Tax=Shewanella nanhaiensis TaxID=2864872 RepID=A0ABS7E740_9GAMM|nr:LysR family transcriptional regulator [Shewanella nanhaiensis]MBW8185497.1 LysR family transcriptional regulator [Shewanella nanhaiensis]